MYRENEYRDYEQNDEFNAETDSEFDLENFQDESEFNLQSEDQFEIDPEFDLEADNETDAGEMEFENEDELESPQDEMEAELEYVTNEQEFSNWVNEVVVRDHRNRNLRPVLRSPIGRRAVKQMSKIAFRTLPFIGQRRSGFNRPGVRTPWNNRHRNRPFPYHRNRYWNRNRQGPYKGWGMNQNIDNQSYPDQGAQPYDSSAAQAPPYQDGSFKNFILDTIKNLSQQIAAGNDSIAALKSSMVNSATNNYPAILQPKDQPDASAEPPPAVSTPPPSGEFEMEDHEDMEMDGEATDSEGTFNEMEEMELASELLSLNNEMELDHFLGNLFKKAISGVTGILGGKDTGVLKGLLKKVIKKALPIAGTAAGTFFGGPVGAALGAKVGSAASDVFELELEGLSNEDREFEVAKAVVRLSGNAARQLTERRTGDPGEDARQAMIHAATRYAPGLIMKRNHRFRYDGPSGFGDGAPSQSFGAGGRWYRKGNRIILDNAF